jgi:sigma-B regulation protein RsbU (phosphoserine phosphatase)
VDARVLNRFRHALAARHDGLRAWLRTGAPSAVPTNGDGLDEAHDAEACPALAEVDAALDRIAQGTFGQCALCDGEVEEDRLELDFTTCVCLGHYSEQEIAALERDLELAARVQRHLYPCGVPALPGVEIAAHAQPAHLLSGDYYDFFPFRGTRQGVALADVMGKGLPASMLMANLQASLRILGPEHDALDALAARLNGLFRYNLRLIRFISLFLLALDEGADALEYCNAGHLPPLLLRAATKRVDRLLPTGPGIGLVPDPTFETKPVPFHPGDLLVLYTDGLTEARSPAGEEFGEERLRRYLLHHHAQPAEAFLSGLRRTLTRFTGGHLHDDLSLLVVRRS